MINKYIKELLENQNRVIVPDLGAFLHKGDSQKVIYFNEFLRFNDGLLINQIAEKEKIDQIEAAKKLKGFVEETNKKLHAKQHVMLEGIGSLFLDANEKIQLKAEHELTIQEDEPVKEIIIEADKEPIVTPDKDLLVIDHKAEELNSNLITTPLENKPVEKEIVKEVVKEIPKAEQVQPSTKPVQKPQPKAPVHKTKTTVQLKTSKSNKGILWIAGILILAIIGIVYYFVIRPLYTDNTVNQNKLIKNDTIVKTKPSPTTDSLKKTEDKPVISTAGKKYYLVAGCFIQEENADKLTQMLKKEGYNAEKFAKIEQMYFVSVASYNDKIQAQNELNNLKAKGFFEVWIKYY